MKTSFALCAALSIALLAAAPAYAERQVEGDFGGKTKCENGLKKAGFKDELTQNLTWYTYNEISQEEKAMSWPDSANGLNFDAREGRKLQMQHALKALHALNCEAQDNPAQSGNGLQQGTVNSTKNAVTPNSYVAPAQPGQ